MCLDKNNAIRLPNNEIGSGEAVIVHKIFVSTSNHWHYSSYGYCVLKDNFR